MPNFCDVALPVPLDRSFTYEVNGAVPSVGARVLVPFGGQRLMGVVLRVHDDRPVDAAAIKPVQQVLDDAPLLSDELMHLAKWIAQYYVAPLGEVLRGMMPLAAEVRRHFVYRIAEAGQRVLREGATLYGTEAKGAARRSKLSIEEQNREFTVLNSLIDGNAVKASAVRSATKASKSLLDGMVKKKWLTRDAVAEERDARRTERIAVLVGQGTGNREQGTEGNELGLTNGLRLPKLNANQTAILDELAAADGRMRVVDLRESTVLRELGVPASTLATLVKRGLIVIEEAPEDFHLGGLPANGKKSAHEHTLNEAQMEALS
jgi:primosomal protein N' (replication factor Y)